MNIYGIGTDIVKKVRVNKVWDKFTNTFSQKILSDFEIAELEQITDKISYLAKRFAAKEAFSKALGTGFSQKVTLPEIEIYNDNLGKPHIKLHGQTKKLSENLKIKDIHLSISDEDEFAVAFVIICI